MSLGVAGPVHRAVRYGIAACLFVWAGAAYGAELKQVNEKVFPLSESGRLEIENQNGRITIEAWARKDVRVQITRTVRTSDDSKAEALMKELRADVTVTSDRIRIESRSPKRAESVGIWDVLGQRVTAVNIHYYVQAPAGTRLLLETNNGEIRVRGMAGGITGQTVNGAIEITGASGPIVVSTTNGSITLSGLEGSARAETTNGDMIAAFRKVVPEGPIDLATTNGNVEVALPGNANATLDAVTSNGRVTVSFPIHSKGTLSSKTVRGTIGSGGASISLRTTNGNVVVQKAGQSRKS
jgi:DUF4097 and DUF4098 domain-containing protein YvlB